MCLYSEILLLPSTSIAVTVLESLKIDIDGKAHTHNRG